MINFKKTFYFYAADAQLNFFVHNIFDTLIGGLDNDMQLNIEHDNPYRYVNF